MKMFLRVNREMARALIGHIVNVTQPSQVQGMKTHHCVWTLVYNAVVVSFLRHQGSDCFTISPCGKFVKLGVSLSAMTKDVAGVLAERPDVTRVTVTTRHKEVYMIQNDEFGYSPWIGWCPLKPPVIEQSSEEKAFRLLASGVDLYYQFSDDPSVWRRGEARYRELIRDGRALGLSETAMDSIIRRMTK